MITFKGATILLVRFTGLKGTPVNPLPGVRIPVADGLIRAAPLIVSEKLRKGLRHGRPGAIFLIPAAPRAQHAMDLGIVHSIEIEAAMACRRMTDDTVGVNGAMLRRAPWRRCARGDFAPRQGGALALVLGIFRNARSESGLVFEIAAVTVEV